MNEVVQKLIELGFTNTQGISEKKTVVTVRIRTAKGWTYEKFDSSDMNAIALWSANHQPE